MSTEVVKVKVRSAAIRGDPFVTIHDERKARLQCRKLDRVEQRMLGDLDERFCRAWWSEATGWVLLEPLHLGVW